MPLPTEPIGSIPRPASLLEAVRAVQAGHIPQNLLDAQYEVAVRETLAHFEATGSPVLTDGEQTKPSFATYPLAGLPNLAPDGVVIPFADGHMRQLPRLIAGPFRYRTYASAYLKEAQKYTRLPLKQAVISASALSLLYPALEIDGYSREAFLEDLVHETETDIRQCLAAGAHKVQMDFTEGRLSVLLDPTKQLLKNFVALNNQVLDRFSEEERTRIGVHTCPGGDLDSTHSAGVNYADLLPSLFELHAGNFYLQLASEPDRVSVLKIIAEYAGPNQRIFVGVIDSLSPRIETPQEVRDSVLEAADYLSPDRLGSTDDCGFSPFGDDTSTARETAFAKIRARVVGTGLASQALGL